MKPFLIFLLCLLSASVFGAGLTISTTNGYGTNLTVSGDFPDTNGIFYGNGLGLSNVVASPPVIPYFNPATRITNNPIVPYDIYDQLDVRDPTVSPNFHGKYWCYYDYFNWNSSQVVWSPNWVIMINEADSIDFTNWTTNGVVLEGLTNTPAAWNSGNLASPGVYCESNSVWNGGQDTWYLYGVACDQTTGDPGPAGGVFLATSTNGYNFTFYSNNWVFKSSQPWAMGRQDAPSVFKVGSTYAMLYSAPNGMPYAQGLATAPSPYGPWTEAAFNPIILNPGNINIDGTEKAAVVQLTNGSPAFFFVFADSLNLTLGPQNGLLPVFYTPDILAGPVTTVYTLLLNNWPGPYDSGGIAGPGACVMTNGDVGLLYDSNLSGEGDSVHDRQIFIAALTPTNVVAFNNLTLAGTTTFGLSGQNFISGGDGSAQLANGNLVLNANGDLVIDLSGTSVGGDKLAVNKTNSAASGDQYVATFYAPNGNAGTYVGNADACDQEFGIFVRGSVASLAMACETGITIDNGNNLATTGSGNITAAGQFIGSGAGLTSLSTLFNATIGSPINPATPVTYLIIQNGATQYYVPLYQ
jgi:hypothetical protein